MCLKLLGVPSERIDHCENCGFKQYDHDYIHIPLHFRNLLRIHTAIGDDTYPPEYLDESQW